MPKVNVIAKKELLPFFKRGDKLTIVPILYKEDTLLVNEIYGIFSNGKFVKIFEPVDQTRSLRGLVVKKISDALYAPRGTYKKSVIVTDDGREYPDTLVRNFNDFFDKV